MAKKCILGVECDGGGGGGGVVGNKMEKLSRNRTYRNKVIKFSE